LNGLGSKISGGTTCGMIFASLPVMKGADLNTALELMGHADMKMTIRYAHLAQNVKMRAVGLLEDDGMKIVH
jgi:hypothetical protein